MLSKSNHFKLKLSFQSMYALMAKCEELSTNIRPVYQLADQMYPFIQTSNVFEEMQFDIFFSAKFHIFHRKMLRLKYTKPANPVRNFCMQKLAAPP